MMCGIQLSQGKVAWISAEDFEAVRKFKWTATNNRFRTYADKWYAMRKERDSRGVRRTLYLHRFIVELHGDVLPPDHVVDHINGDGLDCRYENLEIVTVGDNARRGNRKRWGRVDSGVGFD